MVTSHRVIHYQKPLKNKYGVLLASFLVLLATIPIAYGSSIYDLEIYSIDLPECENEVSVFGTSNNGTYKVLYLLGHTMRRDIFFDATTMPASTIIIDNDLIKTIKINFKSRERNTVRWLRSEADVHEIKVKKVEIEAVSDKEREKWAGELK